MCHHGLKLFFQAIDFSIKKKKKKKNFDLDAALSRDEGELMDNNISTALDKENQEPGANNEECDGNDEVAFDLIKFSSNSTLSVQTDP